MKRLIVILLILLIAICSSCNNSDNTAVDNNNGENIDYEKAYADHSNASDELNDINLINIDQDSYQMILYYKDLKGYLVPVMRQIPKRENIARSAVDALVNNSDNRIDLRETDLIPVLPENIEFELAIKDENLVRINLNNAIMSFKSQQEEMVAIQSIVYTLTEFDNIDKVQILVDNDIINTLTNGTSVKEPLVRANINTLNNIVEGEYVKKTFYSYNNTSNHYTYFFPITKNISKDNINLENMLQAHINILKETDAKCPEGLEINQISVENETADIYIKQIDTKQTELKHFMNSVCLMLNENYGIIRVNLITDNTEEAYQVPIYANTYK